MSVDTTFKPLTGIVQVGASAVQVVPTQSFGVTTFRVRCLTAGYLTWGPKSTVTAGGAPAPGPVANTLGLATNAVAYIDVPATSWFISSVAAGFEICGGQGGTSG
jgi:hypothetical protein